MEEKKFRMRYPLREKIGVPELLVGREKEFGILDHWLSLIPKCLSKSKVILAKENGIEPRSGSNIFRQIRNPTVISSRNILKSLKQIQTMILDDYRQLTTDN